jgi:hypothetical protein
VTLKCLRLGMRQITPELGHKPLLCLCLLDRIRGQAGRLPSTHPSKHAPSGRLCSVWLISRPLACACRPCLWHPITIHNCSIFQFFTLPASLIPGTAGRVAAPSLHSVWAPAFGFVASSEITNQTQPKSSTTTRNF